MTYILQDILRGSPCPPESHLYAKMMPSPQDLRLLGSLWTSLAREVAAMPTVSQ